MGVTSAHSLNEFFRDAIDLALRNQGVGATELTSFYLVNLLVDQASALPSDEALAIKICESAHAPPGTRAQKLREVGDTSLFVSGFFPDSLNRSLIDVDYYIGIGEIAYGHLGRMIRPAAPDSFSQVFSELSDKFARFVEVLSEVANACAISSSADVLSLYEKYRKTGSRTALARLTRHGFKVPAGGAVH